MTHEASAAVRIRARVEYGQLQLADRHPYRLRDRWSGELILPRAALMDDDDLPAAPWSGVREVLPTGATLLVHVRKPDREDGLRRLDPHRVALEQPWAFVELVLLQALRLVRKPRKRSRLEDCPGTIPAISLEARSVNHAYSLISEAYEGWRRSHTGNVFREVFFQSSDPDGLPWWRPLGDLRADD